MNNEIIKVAVAIATMDARDRSGLLDYLFDVYTQPDEAYKAAAIKKPRVRRSKSNTFLSSEQKKQLKSEYKQIAEKYGSSVARKTVREKFNVSDNTVGRVIGTVKTSKPKRSRNNLSVQQKQAAIAHFKKQQEQFGTSRAVDITARDYKVSKSWVWMHTRELRA